MALLTAEDVLNKAFSKTKYREGFDQDEVDDFLDEVAHTVSSLIAERDDLAAKLQQAQAGGAPLGAEAAPLTEAGGVPGTSGLLGAATDPNPPSPAGMLAMAQKLHDEYVHAGEEEKDRVIDEAKSKAESIVEQAQQDAKARMEDLAAERGDLERKIDDLRRFERDYRSRLKSFLENLLGDLDHGTVRGGETPPAVVVDDASDAPSDAPGAPDSEWSTADASGDGGDVEQGEVHAAEATDVSDDDSEATAQEPPVRESFGYQPPVQAPQGDEEASPSNSASPFAPVTQQEPNVAGDDVAGERQDGPRYPEAF